MRGPATGALGIAVLLLTATAAVAQYDITLLTDEADLLAELTFDGYTGDPNSWSDTWSGPTWGGTTFVTTSVSVSETVFDSEGDFASGDANAALEGTVINAAHRLSAVAITNWGRTSALLMPEPHARSEVRLVFEVGPNPVPLEVGVVRAEGRGAYSLYDLTADDYVLNQPETVAALDSVTLQPSHQYLLHFYADMAGDGEARAYADFHGTIPEPATATMLALGAGLLRRRRFRGPGG